MRRLAFLLILLLLIPSISQARPRGIYRTVGSGTVTQANMRLSGVDGGAFVDFGAANVLTTKVGHLLKITDSAGKSIMGYIKAAGTGETLNDVMAGFNFTSGWTTSNTSIVDNNTFQLTSANGYIAKAAALTIGALYKSKYSATDSSGISYVNNANETLANNDNTYSYKTSTNFPLRVRLLADSGTVDVSVLEVNKVLTPSATGVTIVSTKDGTQYNWFNKNSAFNWNDASGYTYQIIQENGKHIYSSAITSGTLHLDASNTAMFFHDSIDFSSYAGTDAGSTPYLIAFYDSDGYMASAYGGAVGAGESLDSELTGDATFDDDSKWTAGTGWAVSGGNATATSAAALTYIYTKSTINGNNKIYKTVLTCSGLTGGTFAIRIQAETYGTTRSGTGTFTEYITKQSSNARAIGIAPMTTLSAIFSDFSVKLVLDVPITGLHLFTTKNGTTRGMATKASSFNPNAITKVKIYRAY